MRFGTRRACTPAFLVIFSVLAACGSGSDASGSEPDIGEIPVIRNTSELVLPLDAYGLDSLEYTSIRRAAWRLIRDCVQAFGSEYTVPEAILYKDVPQFDHPHERRYGLYDERSASAWGYNVPPEKQPPAEGARAWNPSEAELLLVRGAPKETQPTRPTDRDGRELPEGGCQGEADRVLAEGTSASRDQNLPNELAFEANKRALGDTRVRDAMRRWSECMAARGYKYDTVWQPNDAPWPEPANDQEIATAVADVRCKHETNLLGTMVTVEAAYHEQAIEQRAEELKAVQTRTRALATSAARVVSKG
jgi:hypothetical protein